MEVRVVGRRREHERHGQGGQRRDDRGRIERRPLEWTVTRTMTAAIATCVERLAVLQCLLQRAQQEGDEDPRGRLPAGPMTAEPARLADRLKRCPGFGGKGE